MLLLKSNETAVRWHWDRNPDLRGALGLVIHLQAHSQSGEGQQRWAEHCLVSAAVLVCGSQRDPGPDQRPPPQLSGCWQPATWSLFKWTSCLFFLHIGFSSIWKQNSSPSACFWDHHNCMEDNWRQLNLRKTLLIRNTVSINVCVSSFFAKWSLCLSQLCKGRSGNYPAAYEEEEKCATILSWTLCF